MSFEPSTSEVAATYRLPVIGIIGGVGSGKSSVARWVGSQANVAIVDADQLGHQALRTDAVKSALRQRFGQSVFDAKGDVQRSTLGKLVFGDSDRSRTARRDLEEIVHPVIEQLTVDAISKAKSEHRDAMLLDAAVLLEAGWDKRCDAVVFVDASEAVRQRRVATRSGWSNDELRKRESSQLSLQEKRRRSDVVVSNETDDSQAGQQLLEFLCRNWSISCKPLPNASQQS